MKTFELPAVIRHATDCHGNEHLYEITPMAFDESFDLGIELADLIGGPIGNALKAMMTGGDVDLDAVSNADIGTALQELTTIPRRIMDAGGSLLLAKLLDGVMRAGDPDANDVRPKQYLRNPAARSAAFAAGNQAEVLEALKLVLEVNYGPFLADLSAAVSPYLSGFGAGLAKLDPKNLQTPQSEKPKANGSATSAPLRPIEPE